MTSVSLIGSTARAFLGDLEPLFNPPKLPALAEVVPISTGTLGVGLVVLNTSDWSSICTAFFF